jgi:site-specific DNA-cytosine methylase
LVENKIEVTEKVTQKQKKRALDLFCGTKSVTRALEDLGFEVVTLDIRKSCAPTYATDILEWDYKKCCHQHEFEVVFASVPCTEFSKALTTRPRDLKLADKIARKTLEIISWLQPEKYFIENPAGGLLQKRPYMRNISYIQVDYCQFQPWWGYKKPTFIFGTVQGLKNQVCDGWTCKAIMPGTKRHKIWLGGLGTVLNQKDKFRVPKALIEYLCTGQKPKLEGPEGWEKEE